MVVLLPLPGSVLCEDPFSRYPCLVEHFVFIFCFRGFCVSTTSVEKSLAFRKTLSQTYRHTNIHRSFSDCMFSAAFGVIRVDFVLGFMNILLVCFGSIVVFRFHFAVVFSATESGVSRQY